MVGAGQLVDLVAQDGQALVGHDVVDGHGRAAALHRPGRAQALAGDVSRVGVPQYDSTPMARTCFMRNITVTGGVAPARAYIDELLPDILEGRIDPGRVFDRTVTLDEVPDGYRAMAQREALKVLVQP